MPHIPPENVFFYPSMPPGMAVQKQFDQVTGNGPDYQVALEDMRAKADQFPQANYIINVVPTTYAPQASATGLPVKMKSF